MDATRILDGTKVVFKHVHRTSPEIEILQYLASGERRADPRNHTLFLLDILEDENDPSHVLLVFPLMRDVRTPRLASIREAVGYIEQSLEVRVVSH